jgi:CHAD domain-containing protein
MRLAEHRVERSRADRALVARYLSANLAAVRASEPGLRTADEDAVHDTRVAVQRLRSTLRTFRPLFGRTRAASVRAELRWFADLLGGLRDSHVMANRLATALSSEPSELVVGPVAVRVRSELAAETARHHRELTEHLGGPRYATLVASVAGLVDEVAPHGARRCRGLARRALRRARRRLDAAVSAAPAERDAALHRARRAVKRARYAVEVLRRADGRPSRRLSRRLAMLQDQLGVNQDAVVTREWLRGAGMRAQLAGENGFTFGLLIGRQDCAAAEQRSRLRRAIRRTWRPKARRWLEPGRRPSR